MPLVATSHMVMGWFGYTLDFPGIELVGPVLGTALFFYGGWPFLVGGVREIRDRVPGMMLLIATAISVAYIASLATSLGFFDLEFWWELGALVTIMLLGHWQEMKAIGQAQGALAALAALLPDEAERVAEDGTVETVPAAALRLGDVVLVRSGARVPADGEVVDGEAEMDESMITGESRPVPRGPRDRVVAGTVATDSAVRVRIEAVGDDTALAGIQRLVSQAQESRGRGQVLADRFAALLFYIAMGAGIATFAVWSLLGDVNAAVVRTVTVLVIACPHALGLAIPLVIAITTAVSAKAGILVKDRLAIERMRTVDAVLFDKTGTLTKGSTPSRASAAPKGPTRTRCCTSRRPSSPTRSTRSPAPSSPTTGTSTARARGPPTSARAPAEASKPLWTASGSRSAGPRSCGSWSSPPRRNWPGTSARGRAAAPPSSTSSPSAVPLTTANRRSSAPSPSKTRSGPKRSRPSLTCEPKACRRSR
nr:hypothetical protein GCM10025732_00430 [Glycomyces mayteni]